MLGQLSELEGLATAIEGLTPEAAALAYSQAVLQLVPPYASLFLDPDGMLNSTPTEAVQRWYMQVGFEVRPEWRAGAPDHLGVELHALASQMERDRVRAAAFFEEYLMSWAPVCCLAIERLEGVPLYPALATVTLETLLRQASVN